MLELECSDENCAEIFSFDACNSYFNRAFTVASIANGFTVAQLSNFLNDLIFAKQRIFKQSRKTGATQGPYTVWAT